MEGKNPEKAGQMPRSWGVTEGHRDHMGFVGVHIWESGLFSGPLKALGFPLPLSEPGSLILSGLSRKRAENPEARIAMWVSRGGPFMLLTR